MKLLHERQARQTLEITYDDCRDVLEKKLPKKRRGCTHFLPALAIVIASRAAVVARRANQTQSHCHVILQFQINMHQNRDPEDSLPAEHEEIHILTVGRCHAASSLHVMLCRITPREVFAQARRLALRQPLCANRKCTNAPITSIALGIKPSPHEGKHYTMITNFPVCANEICHVVVIEQHGEMLEALNKEAQRTPADQRPHKTVADLAREHLKWLAEVEQREQKLREMHSKLPPSTKRKRRIARTVMDLLEETIDRQLAKERDDNEKEAMRKAEEQNKKIARQEKKAKENAKKRKKKEEKQRQADEKEAQRKMELQDLWLPPSKFLAQVKKKRKNVPSGEMPFRWQGRHWPSLRPTTWMLWKCNKNSVGGVECKKS